MQETLAAITKDIQTLMTTQPRVLIAIDGPDGSGKTMFAENLTDHLLSSDIATLHASVDGFHHLRDKRYERGRTSPEGFFLDSYDYETFKKVLLLPFKNGEKTIVTAVHDVETDALLPRAPLEVGDSRVLVIDGIFLHRDELQDFWDYSLFLDVNFDETFKRMATRDGCPPDPRDDANQRYRQGQQLYFQTCNPKSRATRAVDNTDFNHPKIAH